LHQKLRRAGLEKLREYGFTGATGFPLITYGGFKEGKPDLDFARADADMKLLRELGFKSVYSYGGGLQGQGLHSYWMDGASANAMKAAEMTDYSEFIKTIYTAIQKHSDAENWLPVYYCLSDEPIGADIERSRQNAAAYRKAFPKGPPYFTVISSYAGNDPKDPHLVLGSTAHVADYNLHSEDSVKLLKERDGDWAFYNGGNRWTYGYYMYKCVREFDMKFRYSWHYNLPMSNPYYALDCREDDYAWVNASPDGVLIPSMIFERIREGVNDYRRLITLERRAKEKNDKDAQNLIAERMKTFKLGERENKSPVSDWQEFRLKVSDAIERLR
jgi:hypothetical protein